MGNTVGFGVIGCGVIAPWHTQSIRDIPHARLVAVCDVIPEKADSLAKDAGGVRAYYDVDALLRDSEIDAVCVCVPSGLHAKIGVLAALAGKHVLCEKPLDVTLDHMDELISVCARQGVTLGCIFQRRTQKLWQAVRDAVQGGSIGRLILADAYIKYYRSQAYYDSAGWRGTWELDGGGALMNQGVHCVDLMRWIAGDPVSVYARCAHLARKIEVEDTACAVVEYSCGAMGIIEATTSVYNGMDHRLEFHGETGNVLVEGARIVRWETEDGSGPPESLVADDPQAAANPADIGIENHRAQIKDFADAIIQKRAPLVTGVEARKSVEFILGIYRSSELRQPVRFPLT
ncbi:MAG: Gfo/Idh/MocA family oxidoreductase [Armatimonadetes bacterium]|nr:Gfo/Idh/MocA family oxidoreductase [Armatimonadota bacterium]